MIFRMAVGQGGTSKLPGRVEYLPVEWHTKFRDRAGEGDTGNQSGHLRLRDITLYRIPHLRSFVNDALLDVLYFMSPTYHQVTMGRSITLVFLSTISPQSSRVCTIFLSSLIGDPR